MTKEEAINVIIKGGCDTNLISDGYHTFSELYEHRIVLFIALCNLMCTIDDSNDTDIYHVWRSKAHSDGSEWDGWFIMGIGKEKGKQISYHLPIEKWAHTGFCDTLDKAPDFDGHTSSDVLSRLATI